MTDMPPLPTCMLLSEFVEDLGCDRLAGHEGSHIDLRLQVTWEVMDDGAGI